MFFYNVGIYLYVFAIRVVSLFNGKAKLWIDGRKNWRSNLQTQIKKLGSHPKILVHCASLGEFEQGRPLIEALKKKYPGHKIILSFFSPSGYEIQKNYEFADVVTYLPADTKQNAIDFINYCNPQTVIFIKYEFWLNFLFQLHKKNIPTYLVSAVIKKHQSFFKWYGKNFIKALHTYKKVLVQDEDSLKLLESLNVRTGAVCGDTRMDRVIAIKERSIDVQEVKEFCENNFVIIAGSTWQKDEELLLKVFSKLKPQHPNLKLILVPHEVDEKNIHRLLQNENLKNNSFSLYTKPNSIKEKDILIIDTIGILSSIYRYGKIAYIGGGFDTGIHNSLEAAVYGLPLVFGTNHKKFNEAQDLLATKGAFEVSDEATLFKTLESYLKNAQIFENASKACLNYVNANKGATQKILGHLQID